MKIHVFVVVDESYSYGDLELSEEKYFTTEELRDDYLDFLRKDYLEDRDLEEYEPNNFCEKSGRQRWAYGISKNEKDLEIIETKTW